MHHTLRARRCLEREERLRALAAALDLLFDGVGNLPARAGELRGRLARLSSDPLDRNPGP